MALKAFALNVSLNTILGEWISCVQVVPTISKVLRFAAAKRCKHSKDKELHCNHTWPYVQHHKIKNKHSVVVTFCILGSLRQPTFGVFTLNFSHLEFFQSLLIRVWKCFFSFQVSCEHADWSLLLMQGEELATRHWLNRPTVTKLLFYSLLFEVSYTLLFPV